MQALPFTLSVSLLLMSFGCGVNPAATTPSEATYSIASTAQAQALAHVMAGLPFKKFNDLGEYQKSLLPISALDEDRAYAVVLDRDLPAIQTRMLMDKLWSISDRVVFVDDAISAWKLAEVKDVYECFQCDISGSKLRVVVETSYKVGGAGDFEFIFEIENQDLILKSITLIAIID